MLRMLILLGSMLLLGGCGAKEERALMTSYTKNLPYHKQLQKTEKFQFYNARETKIMVTATYLMTSPLASHNEVFIVGVHKEEGRCHLLEQTLKLNGHKAVSMEKLGIKDKRLTNIPLISDWGKYYLVRFPKLKEKSLRLTFESMRYGKGSLAFAKVAKYLLP